MAAGTKYHKVMANNKTSEFANFGEGIGLLSVPHDEIKAKLEGGLPALLSFAQQSEGGCVFQPALCQVRTLCKGCHGLNTSLA